MASAFMSRKKKDSEGALSPRADGEPRSHTVIVPCVCVCVCVCARVHSFGRVIARAVCGEQTQVLCPLGGREAFCPGSSKE